MDIHDYIEYIAKPNKWGGELEKYAIQEIYNINIADYKIITNNKGELLFYQFIYNLNQDYNYNKYLCLITIINNNHYNLLFFLKMKMVN